MNRQPVMLLRLLGLSAVLALAACGSESPAPAPAATPAPVAEAPAPSQNSTPASTANEARATPEDVAQETVAQETAAVQEDVADAAPAAGDATADTDSTASAPAAPAAPAPVVKPEGPEPRLGTDYFVIDPPQLLAGVPGKVEVVEVFSYTCIHCARLEMLIPAWKKTLPEQVNFIYAPMSHGAYEPIARAFYAAQAMGEMEKTHSGLYKALGEQQKIGRGRIEDMAAIYADLGVDAEALKAAASSFAVNTQITRNQRTLARWGIEGTPTLVVAGKYRIVITADRGHEGALQAARWLAQREIAEQASAN